MVVVWDEVYPRRWQLIHLWYLGWERKLKGRRQRWYLSVWRLAMGVPGTACSRRQWQRPTRRPVEHHILDSQLEILAKSKSRSLPFWSNNSGAIYGSDPQRPLERWVFFSQHIRKTSDTPKSVICIVSYAPLSFDV